MFTAYIGRVQNYENVLEKNFPKAVKVYRTFFDGMKYFYSDMKRYLKIARIASTSPLGLKALNRQELELYMQVPRDMVKVAPAIIITSLPFVGYAIYPLIFAFPRVFLTHHFWTPQQRVEFEQYYISYRLSYNKPVFRLLQSKLEQVKDDPQSVLLDNMFGLIGSGFHPTIENILEVKDIFSKPPLEYDSLSMKHIVSIFEVFIRILVWNTSFDLKYILQSFSAQLFQRFFQMDQISKFPTFLTRNSLQSVLKLLLFCNDHIISPGANLPL